MKDILDLQYKQINITQLLPQVYKILFGLAHLAGSLVHC